MNINNLITIKYNNLYNKPDEYNYKIDIIINLIYFKLSWNLLCGKKEKIND